MSSSEQVGLNKQITAGKRYELTVGDSSLILNEDGTIILKGKKILISGADHIEIDSKLVDIN
jgi:type VI secretion system secreted protein VgrG